MLSGKKQLQAQSGYRQQHARGKTHPGRLIILGLLLTRLILRQLLTLEARGVQALARQHALGNGLPPSAISLWTHAGVKSVKRSLQSMKPIACKSFFRSEHLAEDMRLRGTRLAGQGCRGLARGRARASKGPVAHSIAHEG